MNKEPSNHILEMAVNDALTMTPKSYYLLMLKELRDQRFTWIGKYENDLRIFIDKVLRNNGDLESFKYSLDFLNKEMANYEPKW